MLLYSAVHKVLKWFYCHSEPLSFALTQPLDGYMLSIVCLNILMNNIFRNNWNIISPMINPFQSTISYHNGIVCT